MRLPYFPCEDAPALSLPRMIICHLSLAGEAGGMSGTVPAVEVRM